MKNIKRWFVIRHVRFITKVILMAIKINKYQINVEDPSLDEELDHLVDVWKGRG